MLKVLSLVSALALSLPALAATCVTSGAAPGLQFNLKITPVADQDPEDRASYGVLVGVKMENAQIVLGSYRVPVGELVASYEEFYRDDLEIGHEFRNDNFSIVLNVPESEFPALAARRGFKGTVRLPAPYSNEEVERPFSCR